MRSRFGRTQWLSETAGLLSLSQDTCSSPFAVGLLRNRLSCSNTAGNPCLSELCELCRALKRAGPAFVLAQTVEFWTVHVKATVMVKLSPNASRVQSGVRHLRAETMCYLCAKHVGRFEKVLTWLVLEIVGIAVWRIL